MLKYKILAALLCLEKQGLALYRPSGWPQRNGNLMADAVWQNVWVTWTEKETWAGCSELNEELAEQWRCVSLSDTVSLHENSLKKHLTVQQLCQEDLDSAAAQECLR
jgi:hypothetical protein